MSIKFRNKEGKVGDQPSMINHGGGTRDDIILDDAGVAEILTTYYQQLYGHGTPPKVTTWIHGGELMVEVEFVEVEYPIPF